MAKKGLEVREMSPELLDHQIDALVELGKDRLADVLTTHRLAVEKNGTMELSRKMWAELDEARQVYEQTYNGIAAIPLTVDAIEDVFNTIAMAVGEEPLPAPLEEDPPEFIPPELAEEIKQEERKLSGAPTCACGCGYFTKGGTYLPGHDAKHKGKLMRAYYEGDETAGLILNLKGWMKFFHAFARNEDKRRRRAGQARCQICGRPLFDEESVEAGIGPVCAGKHQ